MERLELILTSYTLSELLEENDIEETYVLKLLIDEGLIDLEEYFE